jgi:hypothetical protein
MLSIRYFSVRALVFAMNLMNLFCVQLVYFDCHDSPDIPAIIDHRRHDHSLTVPELHHMAPEWYGVPKLRRQEFKILRIWEGYAQSTRPPDLELLSNPVAGFHLHRKFSSVLPVTVPPWTASRPWD